MAVLLIVPLISVASDRASCADAVDGTKKTLIEAGEKAEDANGKYRKWKDCKESLISGYDSDGSRCDDTANRLRSADNDLRSELSALDRKYRSVKTECSGFESQGGATAAKSGDDHCDLYRPYLGQMPYPALLNLCTQYMPEEECGKCLGFRPTVSGTSVPPPLTVAPGRRKN
jgi:hypothetical protein